eukprot:14073632-Alexandrium_andersonii.AAC.1
MGCQAPAQPRQVLRRNIGHLLANLAPVAPHHVRKGGGHEVRETTAARGEAASGDQKDGRPVRGGPSALLAGRRRKQQVTPCSTPAGHSNYTSGPSTAHDSWHAVSLGQRRHVRKTSRQVAPALPCRHV